MTRGYIRTNETILRYSIFPLEKKKSEVFSEKKEEEETKYNEI